MVIAAVLAGYGEECIEENFKITPDEHINFLKTWLEYDPYGSELINTCKYTDFLNAIEGRMGVKNTFTNNRLLSIMVYYSLDVPVVKMEVDGKKQCFITF